MMVLLEFGYLCKFLLVFFFFSYSLIHQSCCQSAGSCRKHHNRKAPNGKVLVAAVVTGVEEDEVAVDVVGSAVEAVVGVVVSVLAGVVAAVEHLVAVVALAAEVVEDEVHPEEVVADVGSFSLYVNQKHTYFYILRNNKYHLFVHCVSV